MIKIILITGCSSGFGEVTAEYLKNLGYKVIGTTRKELDVTWSFKKIQKTITGYGQIDVLINNAGYGQLGTIADTSEKQIRDQFETNVFGLLKITNAVLPMMRKQNSGIIINVSSVAGFVTNPHGGIYAASKFSIEAITQSLRQEEWKNGIRVTSINPGPFDTKFWDNSKSDIVTQSLLKKAMSRRENPIFFAKKIKEIIESDYIYPRYMVGTNAQVMRTLYRVLPDFVLDILMRFIFGKLSQAQAEPKPDLSI